MPVLNLKVDNSCPMIIEDVSDYTDVLSVGTIALNSLGLGPGADWTLTSILVMTTEILLDDINFSMNNSGLVIEPACVYNRVLAALETNSSFFYELSDTGTPDDIKIIIKTFDKTFFNQTYTIQTQSGANIVNTGASMSTPPRCLTFRNVSIFDEDGTQLDIGQREQIDEIQLEQVRYTVGDVLTADFCGIGIVSHTVEAGFTSRECVAIQLAAKIEEQIDEVNAVYAGNGKIEVSGIEDGFSFCMTVGPDITFITSLTSQVPIASLPSFYDVGNEVIVYPKVSGNLSIKLTVETNDCTSNCSDCEYFEFNTKALNYCDVLCQLNCAIVSGTLKETSCKCQESNVAFVEQLRNILHSMTYMIESGYRYTEIGKLADYALNFMDQKDCGCKCGQSSSSTGNLVKEACKPKCCFCIK